MLRNLVLGSVLADGPHLELDQHDAQDFFGDR